MNEKYQAVKVIAIATNYSVCDRCASVDRSIYQIETFFSEEIDLFLSNLRWLNTVLAVCEYMSFAKSWQEKDCSSQAETWQVKNILMKDFH